MKVIILAGGFGTRISEESHLKPKPMLEIGGRPIMWHIMKTYSYYGFHEFIICCGYKAQVIKEYFANYYLYNSDVTFDFSGHNKFEIHSNAIDPWKVTLVDTGLNTMTGGRVKRVKDYIGKETFMLTYGDGVCNLNIAELVDFHKRQGKMATITTVQPEGRFGVIDIEDSKVLSFKEKKKEDSGWINGGFMVLEPEIIDYINGDETNLEMHTLTEVAAKGMLSAYKHHGFWKCMDTQRDKTELEDLYASDEAPWMVWDN